MASRIWRGFASDNYAGVHPEVLDRIASVNAGHQVAYGDDEPRARRPRATSEPAAHRRARSHRPAGRRRAADSRAIDASARRHSWLRRCNDAAGKR